MYHLNSALPAPYELSNTMNAPQLPMMAKGGKAKHKKILAHFSPKELHVMDHLQGHSERCPKTGLRSYGHLEELFKNPHIIGTVHRHAHAHRSHHEHHHAMGGHEEMAHEGRHGDTEMALIGPHTHHLFHQLAGRSTTNPHTGHPEFWSLGGIFGGLGSALKGAGSTIGRGLSSAARAVSPYASRAASAIGQGAKTLGSGALTAAKAAAPHAKTALTTLAPIAAQMGTQYLANRLQGLPKEEDQLLTQEMVNTLPENMKGIGQAGLGAYNAYRGGATPQQAFGQGLSQYGQNYTGPYSGPLGAAMTGFGGALGQGQDFRSSLGSAVSQVGQGYGGAFGEGLKGAGDYFGGGQNLGQSLRQGLGQGFEALGGRQGLANSAANVLRGYGTPGGMQGAAQREAYGYANRMLPQYYPQEEETGYMEPYSAYGY